MSARRGWTLAKRRVVALAVVTAAGAVAPHCTTAPPRPAATPPPSRATSATPPPAPPPAAVHAVTAAELGASWQPDCPVEPGQLRRVEVNHIGMDGQTHRGELIVNEELVAEVTAVFEQLYQQRFPIEKVRTVDHYRAAADELSMEDNNTSAFNCRRIEGSDDWSLHAYGRAIDLNPLLNPSVHASGTFEPKNAVAYLDRSRTDPGVLHDGDPATRVFTDRGWRWGGYWKSPIDYQHFERP
ncbi:MAG TPA: M15 family metallopeptidase [Mycobacterium sp.]|uniref:M15 family metallopeptidase n=1 Tax=Mycobacterium sp. TaxID=1785 RepID=UPI002D502007|nr:M15 family metallopeptidase [Mycobacterium sp.]HZU46658.1 M15 family metallopeptidase [Mycobacterium sp.]